MYGCVVFKFILFFKLIIIPKNKAIVSRSLTQCYSRRFTVLVWLNFFTSSWHQDNWNVPSKCVLFFGCGLISSHTCCRFDYRQSDGEAINIGLRFLLYVVLKEELPNSMVTWDQSKFMTDSIISFTLVYALDHEAKI